jgi:hypothetical protein
MTGDRYETDRRGWAGLGRFAGCLVLADAGTDRPSSALAAMCAEQVLVEQPEMPNWDCEYPANRWIIRVRRSVGSLDCKIADEARNSRPATPVQRPLRLAQCRRRNVSGMAMVRQASLPLRDSDGRAELAQLANQGSVLVKAGDQAIAAARYARSGSLMPSV